MVEVQKNKYVFTKGRLTKKLKSILFVLPCVTECHAIIQAANDEIINNFLFCCDKRIKF